MAGPRVLIIDPLAADYRRAILAKLPQLAVDAAATKAEALAYIAEANVIGTGFAGLDNDLAAKAGKVQWVQAFSTGMDGIYRLTNLRQDAMLTSARGAHGPQMTEMVFVHMLTLLRGIDRFVRNQDKHRYERWPQPTLFNKTALIVGAGVISESLAPICKAFGMQVIGVTQTVRAIPGFDEVVARADLPTVLPRADFVILLLPLDDSSRNLFDAAMIARMKPTAFLVNLARGGIVDEGALVTALNEGRIAGAGLDVFAAEPLPADSPLWSTPNVFITPHLGGTSDIYVDQVAPILVENLRHFLAGRPQDMMNRVR